MLADWADTHGIDSDDPALASVTDDDWAFEELEPDATTGTDPPGGSPPRTDQPLRLPPEQLGMPRNTETR